jgi:hypothetical protein
MNIEILNWPEPPWEGDYRVMRRTGRDEPIGIVIHICMETTQESPCVAIFISNKQNPHVSLIMFYVFSFTKLEKRSME